MSFVFNSQKRVCSKDSKFTFNDVLERMGFVEPSKKETFVRLCNVAGVEVPKEFNADDALKFVKSTQELFTNRKDKQERWEIIALDWMKEDSRQVLEDMKILGFIDRILPKEKSYGAICILGAVRETNKVRVKYVEELVNSGVDTNFIILLSGERYASGIDGTDIELTKIAEKLGIEKRNLTEAHLFKDILDNSFLNKKYKCVLINTPRGNNPRPTTKTTVEDLCKWINENQFSGKLLFVSDQPNVAYQGAVISEVLEKTKPDFNFEVVGPDTDSQDIQQLIGALGSYIWALMPQIMVEMGVCFRSLEEVKLAKKLYGDQPWISSLMLRG